ncbi:MULTISPECIES: tetratricopeptide repeat protein [unclassified Microbulbifer]|uniref:tetratricopeptide repeat protein n=1 Tax=unclassified Microbulbifer TaxID=2619833 RepID=UPI0027E3E0AA|nr:MULTISPECIES: tetratricopeptide repeat protein [unclassified Microbulbifer]
MLAKAIKTISLWGLLSASLVHAEDNFSRGTAAFKHGDYQEALVQFELERRKGNSDGKLIYNIGITHFKLGNYHEAGLAFRQLTEAPRWRDLGYFQMALVEEKQGRKDRAIRLYREVEAQAESDKLRRLANKRLAALAPAEPRGVKSNPWLGIVSASAGYDDNVFALRDELQLDSSAGDDVYSELFAWGQYRLHGTTSDGWRLQGFGYSRRYREYSSLDINSYSLGLSRDLQWAGWQTELGIAAEHTTLDGTQLTNRAGLVGRLKRSLGGARVTLAYLPSHYSGGGNYTYLDGWRHRFEAKWQRPLRSATVSALYRLDIDDRADLENGGGEFYSYSPTRHSLGLELGWQLRSNWVVSAGFEYRASEYGGSNSLTDTDGVQRREAREADRVKSWLESELQLSPRLQLAGKVSVVDNEENFDLYTHDKTEASLGVRYIF